MIQRIQSIFLLLAAVCSFGLFALPFASTNSAVANSAIFSDGIYNLQDNIALLILFGAAGLMVLISIFLYKNRKSQLLLGRFAIIANLIGLILVIVLFYNESAAVGGDTVVSDELGLYLPVGFLIFALFAQRYINKDDKLVNSMDRLR